MNHMVLVLMRSGKEYKLSLTEEALDELCQHPDIGHKRVFIMGMTDKPAEDIPWNKMFPGTKLYRLKRDMPQVAKPRSTIKIARPGMAVEPAGPIGFYTGDLKTPMYKAHI